MNCKATTFAASGAPNWGYPNSPIAECSGGPEGAMWQALGYCRNPRLDIDSISANGVPENINIDVFDDVEAARRFAETNSMEGGRRVLNVSRHPATNRDVIALIRPEGTTVIPREAAP